MKKEEEKKTYMATKTPTVGFPHLESRQSPQLLQQLFLVWKDDSPSLPTRSTGSTAMLPVFEQEVGCQLAFSTIVMR